MNGPRVYFEIPILNGLPITESMRNQWLVMLIILGLCLFLTHNLQKIPTGKQALAEKGVVMLNNLVDSTMGEGCRHYAPFVAAILLSSLFGSLISVIGLRPTTADLNTTLGWALIVCFLIHYSNIKFHGLKAYLRGYTEPIIIMAPLNLLSEIATPISMSFRHFGNMAGGLVITTLLLSGLAAFSNAILGFLPVPLLQIGIPGVLSLYFDLFTAAMQAFIFSMLTMAYIGNARS